MDPNSNNYYQWNNTINNNPYSSSSGGGGGGGGGVYYGGEYYYGNFNYPHQEQQDEYYNNYNDHHQDYNDYDYNEYYEGEEGSALGGVRVGGVGVGVGSAQGLIGGVIDPLLLTASASISHVSQVSPPQPQQPSAAAVGSFYLLTEPYIPHIQNAPVSALAIDPIMDAVYVAGHTITLNKKRRHAFYSGVVGTTSSTKNTGGGVVGTENTNKMIGVSSSTGDQRVSMLATHSFPDGMLYSAIAGHEEASTNVLNELMDTLYGPGPGPGSSNSSSGGGGGVQPHVGTGTTTTTTTARPSTTTQRKIPKHAYRPPYNRPIDPITQQTTSLFQTTTRNNNNITYNMGISKILPFHSSSSSSSTNNNNNNNNNNHKEGYVCTISPSSVRVHTRGGLFVSENKIEGLVTGTFHPSGMYHQDNGYTDTTDAFLSANTTHVTVGGIPSPNNNNNNKNFKNNSSPNLYCLDLYSMLKEVTSHTVHSSSSSNGKCVITDIATNYETCNLIAGCSDGTLRILDGSWRIGGNYSECAKVKAHGGGIAQIAVKGNLICTTGYSSRSASSRSSSSRSSSSRSSSGGGYNQNHYGSSNSFNSLYAFPDEHVLVFDIRYLGRGGIAHPFSGLNGGPRFVSFLPHYNDSNSGDGGDHKILVASGQNDGGLQIITPFQTGLMNNNEELTDLSNFIKPPLSPTEGECITAMQVMNTDLVMGTSLGNILQYKMNENKIRTIRKTTTATATATTTGVVSQQQQQQQQRQKGMSYNNYTYNPSQAQDLKSDYQYDNNEVISSTEQKEQLDISSYGIDPPPLSIDALSLKNNDDGHHKHSTSHSIFNSYILTKDPILSSLVDVMGKKNPYAFGTLTESVVKQSSKRILSKPLLDIIAEEEKKKNDFLITIPTSKLNLNLGVHHHAEGQIPNANKLLNGSQFSKICYDETDPRSRERRDRHGNKVSL